MPKTKRTCSTSCNTSDSYLYDPKIQNKLASLAKKGDRNAKTLLIKSMYRFVFAVAKQKAPSPDMIEDLAQEIFLTLSGRCLKAYDEAKRINFRSYAAYWIASAVDAYLNTHLLGYPYHIPSNVGLEFRHGNKKNIGIVEELKKRRNVSIVKDKDDKEIDVFDTIPSNDDGFDNIFKDDYINHLERQIDSRLSKKHKEVIFRLFNLGKYKDYPTNSSVSQAIYMGVSPQRLSKILHKSYEKLQNIEK